MSLCYLINDDATGLTDEEGNAQPYFSHCPLFGFTAKVENCNIIFLIAKKLRD